MCQKSLVAINGLGCPIILDLGSLHSTSPALLKALISAAALAHPLRRNRPPSQSIWEPYHAALVDVQQLLTSLECRETDSPAPLLNVLVAASTLILLSLHGSGDDWQYHAQQFVHMIDAHSPASISSSRLGLLLVMLAAHVDIQAFSIGRVTVPTHAWLRWDLPTRIQQSQHQGFLDFELITGYTGSLVTLIARLSQSSHALRYGECSAESSDEDERRVERDDLQKQIDNWTAPSIPDGASTAQRVALPVAWKAIRLAAAIFHRRGQGFHSDLSRPPLGVLEGEHLSMVKEIITSIEHLVHAFRTSGITMGNAMAWPLAVAGSECSHVELVYLQGVVTCLAGEMSDIFFMSHLKLLVSVLQKLWAKHAEMNTALHDEPFSLESLARENGLAIPLF